MTMGWCACGSRASGAGITPVDVLRSSARLRQIRSRFSCLEPNTCQLIGIHCKLAAGLRVYLRSSVSRVWVACCSCLPLPLELCFRSLTRDHVHVLTGLQGLRLVTA